ncbi:MAG: carbon-nitrogen hydrolase family protein [Bacteroidota bacterium]
MRNHVHVAVVQASPVIMDLEASLDKVAEKVKEAAAQGAELVLFPEAFLPAYPRGLSFGTVVGNREAWGRELWRAYWEQSVAIPGPATERLGEIAREAGVFLAIGVVEKRMVGHSLYCTILYVGPDGHILGKHQKLKPTAAERLIWAEGDASTLTCLDTAWGKVGGLICWENYMPLARMAMYEQGIEIYLAPTADQRETWQSSMRHIACEGRCFVLAANQYVHRDDYPVAWLEKEALANLPEVPSRGGSVIVSPLGEVLAGPLYDEEGILYATLDLNQVVEARFDFDVTGHYARPDVFRFGVKGK